MPKEREYSLEQKRAARDLRVYLKELNSIGNYSLDDAKSTDVPRRAFSLAEEARNVRDRESALLQASASLNVKKISLDFCSVEGVRIMSSKVGKNSLVGSEIKQPHRLSSIFNERKILRQSSVLTQDSSKINHSKTLEPSVRP